MGITVGVTVVATMGGNGNGNKGHGEDGKDKGLNKTDEDLKAIEGERPAQGDHEDHDHEEHLTREDVAKETKHKGRDTGDLANQF